MQTYSLTYAASIATLLASVSFLSEAEALNIVNACLLIAMTAITLIGRYRAGGLKNIFGVKEK